MKKIIFFLTLLLIPLVISINENPPSLTDFHQFYGSVTNLPATGSSQLKARVGIIDMPTVTLANDGKYGYSPTYKVRGRSGDVIQFFVINAGVTKAVGNYTYQSSAVTNLDFSYSSTSPIVNNSQQNVSNQPANTQSSSPSSKSKSTSKSSTNTSSSSQTPSTCQENWECGGWSLCTNSLETRSCHRVDNCATRQGVTIIPAPQPIQQRTCQSGSSSSGTVPLNVCAPGVKRCFGDIIQQCSFDGQSWSDVERCEISCDSRLLLCERGSGPSSTPVEQTPGIPLTSYLFVGIALVVVIGLVSGGFLLHDKKKYAPGKEYVSVSRMKGYDDEQIKDKLLDQGWMERDVEKLLK